MSSSTKSWDGFSEPQSEHESASAGNPFKLTLSFRAFEPTAGEQFDPVIGRIQRTTERASSASAENPFKLTLSFHSGAFEPTAGEQFDPVFGRIQRTAERASSASAGNPCKLTVSFPAL